MFLLLEAPAWQDICSVGHIKMGVALAYQPPQEGLAAAEAKSATKEPISI
jgi:hypothetical protein